MSEQNGNGESKRNGPPGGPGDGRKGNPNMPPGRGLFGIVAVLLMGFMLFMMFNARAGGIDVSLSEFEQAYKDDKIEADSVRIRDDSVIGVTTSIYELGPGKTMLVKTNLASREIVADEVMRFTKRRAINEAPSPLLPILYTFVPLLLLGMLAWMLIVRGLRSASGGGGMLGNFGKSRHRTLTKELTNVTFADVAGIDEAKEEVTEIIEFLKNPKKFTRLGGRIPRGVLLIGEPGCGKTLLAKAIAGEADVPFFSISGSDFVEMFVGVGASRVRDLFKQAKDNAPCIIFLDEIDAVGRRRGGGFTTGGHDEREQTLNAILVEMDGFNPSDGVIVIAATNRNDVLDPALVRPGRFDRQVNVPLPDVKGRLDILNVHVKKIKTAKDVDMERIARATPMFSGADLAAIINEAAISATMHNKDSVEQEDLEEARDKVKFGRAKKSRVREKEDNRLVAYHEAGHAVLQALLPDADPLHKVTIIPRGAAGGATFSLPQKDRMGYGLKWLKATLCLACGGRIAEEKAMSDVSSGAVGDITQVTNIARAMVLEWGMSPKLGFVRYTGMDTRESFLPDKEYSDETARDIDEEIRRIVDEAYAQATRMLDANWDKVIAVAEALLKHETLSADEVFRLMRGESLNRSSVSELLRAEQAKKRAETPTPESKSDAGPELPPGAIATPA